MWNQHRFYIDLVKTYFFASYANLRLFKTPVLKVCFVRKLCIFLYHLYVKVSVLRKDTYKVVLVLYSFNWREESRAIKIGTERSFVVSVPHWLLLSRGIASPAPTA